MPLVFLFSQKLELAENTENSKFSTETMAEIIKFYI